MFGMKTPIDDEDAEQRDERADEHQRRGRAAPEQRGRCAGPTNATAIRARDAIDRRPTSPRSKRVEPELVLEEQVQEQRDAEEREAERGHAEQEEVEALDLAQPLERDAERDRELVGVVRSSSSPSTACISLRPRRGSLSAGRQDADRERGDRDDPRTPTASTRRRRRRAAIPPAMNGASAVPDGLHAAEHREDAGRAPRSDRCR